MRQRKIRLGKGEYEYVYQDGLSLSITDARKYFFDAVKDVSPEVLEDLATEPFRLYKAAGLAFDRDQYKDSEMLVRVKAEFNHTVDHPDWNGHFEEKEVDYSESILAMQKSIFEWSKIHNLDARWCRATAYETLNLWHLSKGIYEARLWHTETKLEPIVAIRSGELDFVFKCRSLYPSVGFRADEKKRITERFEYELDAFLDIRDQIAKEKGMRKPKRKYEYTHFLWFALYQVKMLTQNEIQQKYNPFRASRRTIGEALDSIRNLLKTPADPKSELTRPPSKVGRPRKQ